FIYFCHSCLLQGLQPLCGCISNTNFHFVKEVDLHFMTYLRFHLLHLSTFVIRAYFKDYNRFAVA
ncbi:hypothetical protein, partial [Staphylococcus capitis]